MKKKKAKRSSGRGTTRRTTSKKQENASKVREDIAGMVKSGALDIAEVVMDHAMAGELAPVKFLFEMAGVYPASTDGSTESAEEDCLAKTLLDRLNIPDSPVIADQIEGEEMVMKPTRRVENQDEHEESEEKTEEKELVEA
jgi:hypothetical protein